MHSPAQEDPSNTDRDPVDEDEDDVALTQMCLMSRFDEPTGMPSFVEGMWLTRENAPGFDYHRMRVICPLAVSNPRHAGCHTSRAFGPNTIRGHGQLEVWGFLGAWCRRAGEPQFGDKKSHQRYRPSARDVQQ